MYPTLIEIPSGGTNVGIHTHLDTYLDTTSTSQAIHYFAEATQAVRIDSRLYFINNMHWSPNKRWTKTVAVVVLILLQPNALAEQSPSHNILVHDKNNTGCRSNHSTGALTVSWTAIPETVLYELQIAQDVGGNTSSSKWNKNYRKRKFLLLLSNKM